MKYIYFLLMMVAFSSCGVYYQNVVNVPMLQQKGHLQLAAHGSGSGAEGQGCYALSNSVAVLADYNAIQDPASSHYFGEGGIGLYKSAKSDSTRMIREVFFLGGIGYSTRRGSTLPPNSHEIMTGGYYNRFCLQGNFGKSYTKRSWAVSPRLTTINYYNVNDGRYRKNETYNEVCMGSAFTWRYQIVRHLKFQWQFDITIPLSPVDPHYDISPFNVSVGLLADMNLFGRRRSQG